MKINFKLPQTFYIYSILTIYWISCIFFIYNKQYYFLMLPLLLVFIYLLLFSIDKLLLLISFLTPLSLELKHFIPELPVNLYLPTEPLLFGILIIFLLKFILNENFDKRILKHPISIIIYLHLFWILITSITSTMFIVSIKFFIVRLWFIVGFYIFAAHLFLNHKNIGRYFWLYTIGLLIVIIYTISRQYSYGLFDQQFANRAPQPFYNDHTAYGAALAMIFPFMLGLIFLKQYSKFQRSLAFIVLIILGIAIILSYTRATWVSLFAAFISFIIIFFKIKFKTIIFMLTAFILFVIVFFPNIVAKLEKNKQDASSDLYEQLQSITNITTDASNLERLNRWSCAYRMFLDKPIFGFGPGTYQFKYAPYQLSYQKTIISTDFGDVGNAHSEYLGPLSEQGFLGMILFMAIVFSTLYYALQTYHNTQNNYIRILTLSAIIALITYYTHGLLNNFLDTDKLSLLFFGFTALIVVLNIEHKSETRIENK
ncbi:MAG: O-antigen ligase family protein [Bacteroidales bacterium]|nr:O-antigen ligase family protein [Bacteroidales bacterium]